MYDDRMYSHVLIPSMENEIEASLGSRRSYM